MSDRTCCLRAFTRKSLRLLNTNVHGYKSQTQVHLKPTLLVGCTVLVFLPGTASISRLYSRLSSLSIFTKKDKIIKLHSTASKSSIRDAFAPCSGVCSKNFNIMSRTPTHNTYQHRYESCSPQISQTLV